jgi:hypothetical protein
LSDDCDPAPARIDFGVVTRIGTAVAVGLHREQLEPNRLESWACDTVISKIPGAGHAPE